LRGLRRDEDLSARTYNHYLQAINGFVMWCFSTKRLAANPLVTLEPLNTEIDIRHKRRAPTADEVAELVHSARSSGIRIQGYSGEQRARIYLFSFLPGLRENEMASLTPRSFSLDGAPPTVTVGAAIQSTAVGTCLPHPLGRDAPRLTNAEAGRQALPKLDRRKTWVMVKRDLKLAGIAYETEEGIADFHAAGRHSHITELFRNGATVPQAKELARHSDVRTTMRYTHIGIEDAVPSRRCPSLPEAKRDCRGCTRGA
jgi:site-specific recombinase XerD